MNNVYTRLRYEKNGVRVYAGDIVQNVNDGSKAVVDHAGVCLWLITDSSQQTGIPVTPEDWGVYTCNWNVQICST